jgi:hypothetical protein
MTNKTQKKRTMGGNRIIASILIVSFCFSCNNETKKDALDDQIEPVTTFYQNGRLRESGLMLNDKKDGYYYEFLESGEKYCELIVKDGKLHGIQKWFLNGKLHYIETYENGIKEGKAISYNPRCGYIEEEGEYRKDMRHGLWYIYQKQKLIIVEFYRNDSLIETIYQSPDFEKPDNSIENAPPLSDDEDC